MKQELIFSLVGIAPQLERYKALRLPDEVVRKAAQKALKSVCGQELSLDQLQLKNGALFVSGSPSLRTEIALQKKKILEELARELGKTAPRDIH